MVSNDNGPERGTTKLKAMDGGREERSGGGIHVGDQHLERLATSFEVSARRWELVVYPALFAFIVLACYGFYLIYNLTHDVGELSRNVTSLTASVDSMASNLGNITQDMNQVTREIRGVNSTMGEVSSKMNALEPMRESMDAMNHSTRSMALNTERMGYHVGALNHNIGRPMGMMGSFLPW